MWQKSHVEKGWIEAATARTGVAPKGSSLEDLTSSQLVFAECEVMDTSFQSPSYLHIKGRFPRAFKMPKEQLLLPFTGSWQGHGIYSHSAEVISVKTVTRRWLCLRFIFVRDIETKGEEVSQSKSWCWKQGKGLTGLNLMSVCSSAHSF